VGCPASAPRRTERVRSEHSARHTPGPVRHTTRGAHSPAQSTRRYDPCWTVVALVHAGIRHPAPAPSPPSRCTRQPHHPAEVVRQRGRGIVARRRRRHVNVIARGPGTAGAPRRLPAIKNKKEKQNEIIREEREKETSRQRIRGYHQTTTVWELRFIELVQNIASRLCGTLATRRFRICLYFPSFFFYSPRYTVSARYEGDGSERTVNEKQFRINSLCEETAVNSVDHDDEHHIWCERTACDRAACRRNIGFAGAVRKLVSDEST